MNNIPVEKLRLRLLGDPILAAKTRPVEQITEETERISEAMLDIMYKSHGIGLAGNQVGLLQRIVTIDIEPPTDEDGNELPLHSEGERKLLPKMPITLINPEIVSYSGNLCPFDEGCHVGVGVQYSLSSLFKSNKKLSQARLQQQAATEQKAVAAEQLNNQVQAAYTNYLQSYIELETQQKSVQLAQENYQVVNDRYLNQLALITDMIDASNMKLDAELSEA
ncbi:MAG: peptide deformylase, partial [Lentisphaeria bacterium]|nr:peptide deformylase [Lentisphaeria bacterium]